MKVKDEPILAEVEKSYFVSKKTLVSLFDTIKQLMSEPRAYL